jgi:cytochrome c oxidase cbb3-type subunit IV
MIKDVLTKIGGVGVYGVISICLFFTFFVAASIWALRLKKSYVNSMRELPLNDDCAPPNPNPTTDAEKN